MALGSMTYAGGNLQFLVVRTDSGYIDEQLIDSTEELITPGVDGRRWRTIHGQFPHFRVSTVTECVNYAAAVKAKGTAERMVNTIATFSAVIGGNSYNFQKMHIDSVQCVAVPGPVVASGSTGGAAHMMAEWVMCMCDLDQAILGGS